jgi:hypothetical protein
MSLIAEERIRLGEHAIAANVLRDLTQLRRQSSDWLLLAKCEQAVGNRSASDAALLQAIRINPRLWKVHQDLAERFRQQGEKSLADWHKQRAMT